MHIKMLCNIKHLFKNVFQYQTAEFHSEKPQLLLHQPKTSLHSSPIAYWTPLTWGAQLLGVISSRLFILHGVLAAGILEWTATPSSKGPCFVRTLHCDPTVLGALCGMAHHVIESHKPFHPDKDVIHKRENAAGCS